MKWTLHLSGAWPQQIHRPLVMGILNATPDSFSDGGRLSAADHVQTIVADMIQAGADILDVGGESTRPGHGPVAARDEVARVVPVIEAIRAIDAARPISIDTSKAVVAEAAIAAGASFVNDVTGLGDAGMADVVRRHDCSIVLMRHADLQGDIVTACRRGLERLMARAASSGIAAEQIIVDPGLGFGARPGPSVEDNLALIDSVPEWSQGRPALVGASRKRFVGTMMDEADPALRVQGSVDVAVRAVAAGAAIVRVHDVAQTVAALRRP